MCSDWYTIWVLVAILNQVLNYVNGYDIFTWQNWGSVGLITLAFICGCNYPKED